MQNPNSKVILFCFIIERPLEKIVAFLLFSPSSNNLSLTHCIYLYFNMSDFIDLFLSASTESNVNERKLRREIILLNRKKGKSYLNSI